ncbi:uncharacterized protein [Diadema antillarum]|uniref:uncharacterized protein n=1 Tax=Diadema antillarum TaxID=105358 RepID=UPI003A86D4DF
MGNYIHNREVVLKGKGEFIVSHRPSGESRHSDYDYCKFCYATLSKSSLWKHSCPVGPSGQGEEECASKKKKRVRKASKVLRTYSKDMQDMSALLDGMRQDKCGQEALGDDLILRFGSHWLAKAGADKEQFSNIRGKMRQLGRIMICVKEKDASCRKLSECMKPGKFSVLLDAAKEIAGFNPTTHTYKTPSHILRSGQNLKKAAEIHLAHSLESGDGTKASECSGLMKIIEVRWPELSSNALRNLNERKRNGVELIPLTKDIVNLNQHIDHKIQQCSSKLAEDPLDEDAFFGLEEVVLSKLITINRKRQGEASKLKLRDWEKKKCAQASEEVLSSLDECEKHLVNTLKRLEIRGKKGRTVPILITKDIENSMDLVLSSRHHHVPESNPYLFASATHGSYIRGSDSLRKHAIDCGAERPHLLTSTRLRKSLGTMTQVLNLKDNELDQVADFLGHDIRVHRQFYRMPLDVLQAARVSKVLLAANKGRIGEYAGKGLDDIHVSPDDLVEFDEEDEEGEFDEEQHEENDVTGEEKEEDVSVPTDELEEEMSTTPRSSSATKRPTNFTVIYGKALVGDDGLQTVLVLADKALAHLYRNLCPLFLGVGLQVFEVAKALGMNFGLQHFPQILNGMRSWLWLGHSRTSTLLSSNHFLTAFTPSFLMLTQGYPGLFDALSKQDEGKS